MFEMILSPKKAERRPWEMLLIGLFYASLAVLLVNWIFAQDEVLVKYSGILIVTFTVMFSLPFMYYIIKLEEEKNIKNMSFFRLLREHGRALYALLWLFMGFVIAFSFWYIVLPSTHNFKAQVETYCIINRPLSFNECVAQFDVQKSVKATGSATQAERLFKIFANNIYVLIFTLVFSLIFGAGAIFVLAWNASVIAAAIGIFTQVRIERIPLGLARYMIHGIPEIAAYFVGALAGGIISVAIIKHDINSKKFWNILQDSLNLIIAAVVILFIAAIIEVFVTPLFFY